MPLNFKYWRKIAWVKGRMRFFLKSFRTAYSYFGWIKANRLHDCNLGQSWPAGMAVCPADPLHQGTAMVALSTGVPWSTALSMGGLNESPLNFHWRESFPREKQQLATKNKQLYLVWRKWNYFFFFKFYYFFKFNFIIIIL